MKTGSNVTFLLRLALTLLAFTAVVAAALAGVNPITAPAIAQLNAQKTQEAIEQVLPGGGSALDSFPETDLVSQVYASDSGYAVEVAPSGFDNTISMMVGVDTEGKVLGVSVISHSETAGLGAVAADNTPKGSEFRERFVGQSGTVAVTKDGGQIDALTGATITSRAVCAGVTAALDCVASMG